MASCSESLPFAHVDAPNKRSRPEAFSEAYFTEELQIFLENDDPVFEHFDVYEKGSGNNYAGRCAHCKVVFRGLTPSRAKAHVRKINGKGIKPCNKVPNLVHAFYKLAPALPSRQAAQKEAGQLFSNTEKKVSTDATIADFFYDNASAFNDVDNPGFRLMCIKLTLAGNSYRPPYRKLLSTSLPDASAKRSEKSGETIYTCLPSLGGSLLCDGYADSN